MTVMTRDAEIRRALREILIPELRAVGRRLERVGQHISIRPLSPEALSLRTELLAEIRRLDARIDDVDRELRAAIRESLGARKARRSS